MKIPREYKDLKWAIVVVGILILSSFGISIYLNNVSGEIWIWLEYSSDCCSVEDIDGKADYFADKLHNISFCVQGIGIFLGPLLGYLIRLKIFIKSNRIGF